MNEDYTRNLIKGKITEVIFEEMFRSTEEFTIIQIGYEHTIPELAQYQHHIQIKQILENIRHAPDFVLISQDKTRVFLVEVKYREDFNAEEVSKITKDLYQKWNPIFLFLATQSGFYFDSCRNIVEGNGSVPLLTENWINHSTQASYLGLLKEFIH